MQSHQKTENVWNLEALVPEEELNKTPILIYSPLNEKDQPKLGRHFGLEVRVVMGALAHFLIFLTDPKGDPFDRDALFLCYFKG